MTEEVWINNHKLDVNPTDIQIITNRYSDSFNLTREDSPYAFVSPHGYTVVSMVLAFDITNPESIEQLISVYTQMDQFPFVWIKSNRLVGNISGFSQSIDGYSMYLVNTLTLRHTVDAQGVIFLNVEFYYFNHTPLCHSWSFIDIQPVIGQKKSFTQKQDKTEQQYNFVSGLKPSESGLFTSYFAKEIQRRLSLAANEIKTAPNSLIFSSPQWYPKRQELIDVLNANAVITQEHKYRDAAVDIYELARYNNTNYSWSGTFDKTSLNDSGTAATKLTTEELLANRDTRETIQGYIAYINSTELSLEGLAIQDITITKSNKIAMNKMAGYTEPMLQYMGKAPSVLTIEMIADSDGLYREAEDGATNPITAPLSSSSIINALIAKIDSDSLINFKLAPFRNFKIRNPIVAMSGCKYFAFDKKIYSASSDTQGQESIMLSFVESDLNSLGLKLQSKKVTAKPYYTDFMTMVKFLKDTADRYTGSSTAAEHKAVLDRRDPRLDEQALGVPLATTKIIKQTHAPKLPALYRDNAVGIILINLNAALISTFGIAQNLGSGYKEIIAGQDPEDLSILIKNLDKLKKKNINSAFQGTPTDTKGGFEAAVRDEVITNTQFAIEQAFYYLVYIATSERNPHISGAFVTFAQQLIKDSNNDIEQISGEGIPDLHLGEHIDTDRYPSVNPQKLNPFFFLEQNVYLTPELIKEAYDVASPVVDEQTTDDKTRELLRISEYYREGLPRFRRIEDTAPQQAIDLSQPSMKPITNQVYLAEIQKENIQKIKDEAKIGNIPEWMILTMAEIESGYGTNMRNPTNPKVWGILQIGRDVRKAYAPDGFGNPNEFGQYWWEENTNANIRTCIDWYNDELRYGPDGKGGLKGVGDDYTEITVTPGWLYLLHQQGYPFLKTLIEVHLGLGITNTRHKATLLAQGVKGVNSPIGVIQHFLDEFDRIASKFVSDPNERQKSFDSWLGIEASAVTPLKKKSNAAPKQPTASNQINVQQIAASNISSNGAVYTPIGKSGVEELASQPFENKQSRTFKGMNLTDIDIFGDDDQAQFRALRTGRYFEYGLNLAVPTAKIYIVEGNENNVLDRLYYRKRNLFEVYGVAEVRIITANEDEPVAVAVFSVLNPSSAYTDFDSIASHRLKIDPSKLNTRDEISLKGKSLRLVVGTQIHIRMGFSNDPNELETVFNGEITEIDGESMLSIVAEGYGREMIMREHATDKPHGVGGTLNSSTSSIIHEVMRFDEVQHFGGRDPILSSKNPYARNILHGISVAEIDKTNADRRQDRAANAAIGGITGFGIGGLIFGAPGAVVGGTAGTVIGALKNPTTSRLGINGQTNASDSFIDGDNFLPPLHATASELFTNTYSPPIESVDPYYLLADKSLFTILFSPNRAYHTYFPIYQSTAWDVLMEMEYRHPNTRSQVLNYEQRATYFFGLKEQLYYAESPSITLINSIGSKVQAVFDNTHYANNEKYRDLKPVADFHLFTTEHNIISNDLKISSKFGTQANIRYYEDNPAKSTFKQDDFEYYVMQSDDNLLPQAIRTFDINLLGTDHKASAYRYGQVGLRKETEKMYIGKITVLGNPFIKGGDFAYINDTQRELKGIIKIKECIHTYSTEHGFVTEITPALYVEEAMMTYSYLMTKMGLAFSMISEKLREKILHSYLNANQYTSPIIQLIEKSLVDVDTFNELKNVFAADKNKLDSFDKRGLQLVYFGLLTGAGFGFAAVFGSFQRAGKLIPSTQAGIRNLFIGASKLTANIFNVARATGSSAIGIIEARVAQGAAARGIGMMLVRLAVTGLAAATGMAGALIASPLFIPGMIIGIALMYTIAKVQEVEATRQPLRLFPLLHHGAPYIAGLAGWNDNTYSESLALEARKSIAATGKLVNFGKDIYKSRGSDFNILSSNLIQTRVDRIAEKYKASK